MWAVAAAASAGVALGDTGEFTNGRGDDRSGVFEAEIEELHCCGGGYGGHDYGMAWRCLLLLGCITVVEFDTTTRQTQTEDGVCDVSVEEMVHPAN